MVHNCGTTGEFDKISEQALRGNFIGRRFSMEELDRAKDLRLFDGLRGAVQQLEDSGVDIYYICTDTITCNEKFKWLMFAALNTENVVCDKLLQLLRDISRGEAKKVESVFDVYVEPSNPFNGGGGYVIGTAAACPLFV